MKKKYLHQQKSNKTKIVAQKASLLLCLLHTCHVLLVHSHDLAQHLWDISTGIFVIYTFNIRRESIIGVDMRQPCVFILFCFFKIFFPWKKACLFFSIRFIHVSIAQLTLFTTDLPHLHAPLQNSQIVHQDSLCLLTASWEAKMEKKLWSLAWCKWCCSIGRLQRWSSKSSDRLSSFQRGPQ